MLHAPRGLVDQFWGSVIEGKISLFNNSCCSCTEQEYSVLVAFQIQLHNYNTLAMATPYTIHTSTLFDPKKKAFVSDISVRVNPNSGLIEDVYERKPDNLGSTVPECDIDLRGQLVMPGLVDAHTHIFLHSYE